MSGSRLDNLAAKTIVFLILILLTLSAGAGSRAGGEGTPGIASLEEREKALARQAKLEEREKELTAELLAWDIKIESARKDQERLRMEIPLLESALTGAESGLAESRVLLEEGYEWLGKWVNNLYRYGPVAYLEVLVGAADFNEFVEKAEMVKIIIISQVKMLDEVRYLIDRIQAQISAIKQARNELAVKNEVLSIQIKEMEAAKTGREELLAGLKQQSTDLAERVVQAEKYWYHSLNSLHYLLTHLDSFPWYSLVPETLAFTGKGLLLEYSDQEINRKLNEIGDANLTGLSVHIYPGRFSISGPAAVLGGPDFMLDGNLVLAGEGKVRFQPENLILAGKPVSREVLDFVSSESGMAADFGEAMPGYNLSEVRAEEGKIVILLSPN